MIETFVARIVHEAERVFDLEHGLPAAPEWDALPPGMKLMAGRECSLALTCGSIEEFHALWVGVAIGQGWTYGPTEDARFMQCPSVVLFAQLDEVQKLRAQMLYAVARAATHAFPVPSAV